MLISADLVAALRAARRVFVLTGSGVSAESGVPTFRDAQKGLWAEFDPQKLATPEAFVANPQLVWSWYRWRRELVAAVQPNPAHRAIATLQDLVPNLTLVTQNVDGLHQRAGSKRVIEFHGNLFSDRCFDGDCDVTGADTSTDLPCCPQCGGLLRPGVVWFGEAIPEAAATAAGEAATNCDVFLSVGTSSLVWPAAGLGDAAAVNGASVVEINIDATPQTGRSDYRLQGKAGEILPELVDCLAR